MSYLWSADHGGKTEPPVVALLDTNQSSLLAIDHLLTRQGYRVSGFGDPGRFLAALAGLDPDAICLDVRPASPDLLHTTLQAAGRVPVVALTDGAGTAVVEAGAYDYLTRPLDGTRLVLTLRHAVAERRLARRVAALESPLLGRRFGTVFGRSAAMLDLFRQLDGVSGSDAPVLLRGEPGTGKARLARAVHGRAARRDRPFVEVNLSTTPEPLQAAALFGHSHGAHRVGGLARRGVLDQAPGGVVFLRDVGDLGPTAQAGLLQVLERGAFQRAGGGADVACDVRVMASTSRDLAVDVAAGRFQEALYYRLVGHDLRVPPLRERQEDILPLATELLREHGTAVGLPSHALALEPDAADALVAYRWPGNVRELSAAVQRAAIASGGRSVAAADLPAYVRAEHPVPVDPPRAAAGGELPAETLDSLERRAILAAMRRHSGNAAAVARALGIGRATLYRKLKLYGAGPSAHA